ncbi:uncharacterized protein STEHIDRAFT_126559 [Stereum hirsutum FP-91666 SS1]|uniref:Uncharacterized protein n=1 Tax=Stereum hirsutum (strain FP-91666) TaxID=721885 RepID=R7RYB4_STEHR|nr:uncharacterized protein STEHIDRAFT_126559 [Stereum hirsutum FP-91666 SS1]EIM79337.1 hypothetical protein STEHIDRAFT_126559 [Stereum hirsutum FP-91666 SS1]
MTPGDCPPESSDEITSDSCYDSTSDSGSDVSDEVWPPELNDDLIYHPMSQEERILSQIEDEEFLESYRTPTLYSRDAVWPDDVQPMLDECPMDEQEWLLCEEADREMERQEREAARANAMRNWE